MLHSLHTSLAEGVCARPWGDYCLQDPAFVQDCVTRWTDMRGGAWSDATVTGALSQVQGYLLPPALRGFARWDMT